MSASPAAGPRGAFRVLFVCVGNVCRSPLGELLLTTRLEGDQVTVASAGVSALVDSPMSPDAAAELAARGGSAEAFRARQMTEQMVRDSDLVLTATLELRSRVLSEVPSALRRTFTVREFAALLDEVDPSVGSGSSGPSGTGALGELVAAAADARSGARLDGYDVPDPYRRGPEAHAEAARLMGDAVDRIAKALQR